MCVTDHTGSNNVFLRNFKDDDNSLKFKLGLGLGLGFGIPLLVGLVFLVWFWYVYRRNVRRNAPRFQLKSDRSSGIHDDISLKDFKDKSFVNGDSI